MSKYIYRKQQILKQMGVLCKLTKEELHKLKTATNEIAADNIAHSFIMRYL